MTWDTEFSALVEAITSTAVRQKTSLEAPHREDPKWIQFRARTNWLKDIEFFAWKTGHVDRHESRVEYSLPTPLIRQDLPGRIRRVEHQEVLVEFTTADGEIIEEIFLKEQFQFPGLLREGMAVRARSQLLTDPARDRLGRDEEAQFRDDLQKIEEYRKKAKTRPTVKIKS